MDDAFIIPVEALNQISTGAYVYTSYDAQNETYGDRVDVTTGLSNDEYVEITSGLEVGDTVYYTKAQSLLDMFAMAGAGGNRSGGQMGAGRG